MAARLTPKEAVSSVREYRQKGWRVFPLPVGQKKPDRDEGWKKQIDKVTDDTVEQLWADGQNVGIILDPPLIDIDLDCDESVIVASRFLPKTPMKFGRGGQITHYIYEAENAESAVFIDTTARDRKRDGDDTAKEMILEIRHDNGYTMFPPSVHPSGQRVQFAPKSSWPEVVLFDDLHRRCEVIAACALMIRYWPGPGARNEATMALCGGLVRAEREKKIDERAVEAIVRCIVEEGGNSDPVSDFNALDRTRKTFGKIDAGNDKKKVKGWVSLEKLLGEPGKAVVKQFRDWLKILPKGRRQRASPLLNAPFADQIIWETDGQGTKTPARIAKNATIIIQNDPAFWRSDHDGGDDDASDGDDGGPREPIIYFDEFRRCKMVRAPLPWDGDRNWHKEYPRQWVDVDIIDMQGHLAEHWGFVIGKDGVADGVETLAALNYEHEVREYLAGLRWDHTPRLEQMGPKYFSTLDGEYERFVFKMWMISAVARVMDPGCQVDTVMILEGAQGLGKSSALRVLAKKRDWFTDDVIDMHSKAGTETITGAWLIELGELSSMKRTDVQTVKEFITRRVDKYRPPYGRETIQIPRMCIFAGTVNPEEDGYLKDTTGNRRFWPVACGRAIHLRLLEQERDQLWAEAYDAYRRGERWFLTMNDRDLLGEFERRQLARRERGPLEGRLVGWIQEQFEMSDETTLRFTTAQIASDAYGFTVKEMSEGFRMKGIGEVCRKLGFEHVGRARWNYYPEGDQHVKPRAINSSLYEFTVEQLHNITESDIEMKEIADTVKEGLAGASAGQDDDIPF